MTIDLFGDLIAESEPPKPNVVLESKGKDTRAGALWEAWSLWVELTRRPDYNEINSRFRRIYLEEYKKNRDRDVLLELIDGAARLPARPRDPRDIRRVCMVLGNEKNAAIALAAIRDEHPYIHYTQEVVRPALSSPMDVEEATRLAYLSWTYADHAASDELNHLLNRDDLFTAVKNVSKRLGRKPTPVDLLSCRDYWFTEVDLTAAYRKSGVVETYSTGQKELEDTDDIALSADRYSMELLIRGVEISKIREVHHSAPDGYWQDVTELLDTGDFDHESAYLRLQEEYNWHPKELMRLMRNG